MFCDSGKRRYINVNYSYKKIINVYKGVYSAVDKYEIMNIIFNFHLLVTYIQYFSAQAV